MCMCVRVSQVLTVEYPLGDRRTCTHTPKHLQAYDKYYDAKLAANSAKTYSEGGIGGHKEKEKEEVQED